MTIHVAALIARDTLNGSVRLAVSSTDPNEVPLFESLKRHALSDYIMTEDEFERMKSVYYGEDVEDPDDLDYSLEVFKAPTVE